MTPSHHTRRLRRAGRVPARPDGPRDWRVSGAAYLLAWLRVRPASADVGRLARTARPPRPSWRPVGHARSEPEADMLVDILRRHGIPAFARATSCPQGAGG